MLFLLIFDLTLKGKMRKDFKFDMTCPADKKTLCYTAEAQCNSCLNTQDEQKLHKEGS